LTLYRQGVEGIEYEVAFMLRDCDYYVIRSAGSHGLIDLMAFWEGTSLAIQCKKKTMGTKDQEALMSWCDQHCNHGWPSPIFAYKDKLGHDVAIFLKNLRNGQMLFAWPVKAIRALRKIKREELKAAK